MSSTVAEFRSPFVDFYCSFLFSAVLCLAFRIRVWYASSWLRMNSEVDYALYFNACQLSCFSG